MSKMYFTTTRTLHIHSVAKKKVKIKSRLLTGIRYWSSSVVA